MPKKPTYDELLQRIRELENADHHHRKTLSALGKNAEEASHHRELVLAEAQRLARIGNWFWNAETDETTGSDELLRIFGFDPATQNMPNFKNQCGLCYPERDWELINLNVINALATGCGYELDVHAFRNGQQIHVTTRSEIVRGGDGQIIGLRGTVQDITERKRMEETLKESEQRYRALFDAGSDAILFIDSDTGRILDANSGAAELFGYDHEELLTKKNWELSAEPEETRQKTENARTIPGEVITVPLRFLRRKNGTVFPAELTGRSFFWQDRSVFIAAFRDITERKKTEDTLRESEAKYRALIDQAAEGIVLVDTVNLRFVDFNDAASSGLGYSREEFAGLTLFDVQGSLTRDEFIRRFQAVVAAGGGKFENRQRKKDGTFRDTIISNRVIHLQGRKYVSGIWQDVTERNKTEVALRESEERYRSLIDDQIELVSRFRPDGTLLYINKGYRHFFNTREIVGDKSKWQPIVHPDDLSMIKERLASLSPNNPVVLVENRVYNALGEIRWVQFSNQGFFDDNGALLEIQSVGRDITGQKQSETLLLESEQAFRTLADSGQALIRTSGIDTYCNYFNRVWLEFTGRTLQQEKGNGWLDGVHPDDRERCMDAYLGAFRRREKFSMIYRLHRYDGEYRWLLDEGCPRYDNHGEFIGYIGHCLDITSLKQAEVALQESRTKLKTALASMTDGVFITDCSGKIIEFNEAFATFCRFGNKEECLRQLADYTELFDVFLPNGDAAPLEMWAVPRALRGESATNEEYTILRKDTGETWIGSYSFSPIRDEANAIVGSVTTARDITELKRHEETKRNLEATIRKKLEIILEPEGDLGELELADIIDAPALQTMIEHIYRIMKIGGGVAILDIHGKVLVAVGWQDICTKFHRIHPGSEKNCLESDTVLSGGIPAGESKAYRCKNNLWDIATPIIIGGRHLGNVYVGQFFYDDEVIDYDLFRWQARRYGFDEKEYIAALDRVPRWSRDAVEAAMFFYGSLAKMIASLSYGTIKLGRALTQKDHALHQLNESRALQASLLETIPIPVFYKDSRGQYWGVNKAFENFYGKSKDYLIGKTVFDICPPDLAKIYQEQDVLLFAKPASQVYESKFQDSHGLLHDVIFHKASLVNSQGTVIGLIGAIIDVTERNRTEQENKNLQEQLIQAQKMEAIGTLAGGIAHDFNNILGVILGYAELTYEDSMTGPVKPGDLANIIEAGNRAKDLVKQILSFSRKQSDAKQILLRPAPVIEESIKLLRSTIPRTIDILKDIDQKARFIYADPTQIHQVIMNLCTNAFHAMEDAGGIMAISVEDCTLTHRDLLQYPNVHPGDFVRLTVSDNGPGITPEIMTKIFEPYFTTKEVGKGTGLGLAIVHGIASSAGGFISCESAPGAGTTFHVYFPAVEGKSHEAITPQELDASGSARILLVDDEKMIIKMQKSMLERLGYHINICTSSLDALELFKANPDQFDAVITDQTMPGLTGINLAGQMLKIRPDLPVILCTGYSSQIDEEQVRASGIKGFAMKPVPNKTLAMLLRQVLQGETHHE